MDTLNPKIHLKNLDIVFDSLKCALKLNVAIGFELKNLEDGSCQYNYAHGKKTQLERRKLVPTTEDLTKIKNLLSNTDVIESCTGERAKTKWSLRMLHSLLHYSRRFPWEVRTLYYQNYQ